MKLRQLMMADMQSKAASRARKFTVRCDKAGNSDKFFGQTQVTSDGVTSKKEICNEADECWLAVAGLTMLAGAAMWSKARSSRLFNRRSGM